MAFDFGLTDHLGEALHQEDEDVKGRHDGKWFAASFFLESDIGFSDLIWKVIISQETT